MFDKVGIKLALTRAAIVLIPSYSAAYLTDKMVYVVPTMAAASFLAASINLQNEKTARRVDEDGDSGEIEYGE